jgi:type III restriction enzyme
VTSAAQSPLSSQLALSDRLRGEVEAWEQEGWPGVTRTTYELLRYWFIRDESVPERFFECQKKAIETIVYCHEILQVKNLEQLYQKMAPDMLLSSQAVLDEVRDADFAKYCLKMATGSGKTWVLIALLVWHYFNRSNDEVPNGAKGESKDWYSQHYLVVAPGREVLNRLLDATKGHRDPVRNSRDPNTADMRKTLFVPEAWRSKFSIQILEPLDVRPNTTPPDGPFAFLTNWQQFVLRKDSESVWEELTGAEIEEQPRGEFLLDYFASYPDLVIMNDEAHHLHMTKGEVQEELVWRKFIRRLRDRILADHKKAAGSFVQYDFSATPFFGSGRKRTYFLHIVYDYDLLHAMRDMLVKQLFLEKRLALATDSLDFRAKRKEAESGERIGEIVGLSQGQLILLEIGRRKLEALAEEFKDKGIEKKPVMMVLCEETEVADHVAKHFRAVVDQKGVPYDEKRVLQIHTDLGETDLELARKRLDLIDANNDPLNVVVSVLMLREGFDRKNISVIVVLRATDSDLLLEQIVGRGLRLMFPPEANEAIWQAKIDAIEEIRRNRVPSSSFDFLFIVEHPRFESFYQRLREEGYLIPEGDSSKAKATGDLLAVDAVPSRIPDFDISWPVQVFDQGTFPDLTKIDVSKLPRYSMLTTFGQLKEDLGKLIIQEMHYPTGKRTKTWKFETNVFSYEFFLARAAHAVSEAGKTPVLSGHLADIAQLVDEYASKHVFGEEIDFGDSSNCQVLNYPVIFDFVVEQVRKAILLELGDIHYQATGRWRKLSDLTRLLLRERTSVETWKSIYPRQGFASKGGGFERDFMLGTLEQSAEVLAYAKLDRRHALLIPYRDEYGILRDYEVDFLVKTAARMYLVETKADKDLEDPTVLLKAKAARSWCETASDLATPDGFVQSAKWDYLVLSEGLFKANPGLGFEAFVPLCREQRDRMIERFDRITSRGR